jgi:nicotinate-nucleotide pyrophosphorylase (carboxylating)
LDKGNYKRVITSWLEEDCPSLDYGGFVVGESEGEARLLIQARAVLFQPGCYDTLVVAR